MQRNIFHVVRNPRGSHWEAHLNLPISAINWYAVTHRILYMRKDDFEYVPLGVSVDLSLVVIFFGGL